MDAAYHHRSRSRRGCSSSASGLMMAGARDSAPPSMYAVPTFSSASSSSSSSSSSCRPSLPHPPSHQQHQHLPLFSNITAYSVVEPPLTTGGAPTPPRKRLSRAAKDVLFGSVAGMVAKVFEHPFDLIKVRLQTQPFTTPTNPQERPRGTLYTGAYDAFRSTIRKEGFLGLFRGLSMPIFGATLENATLFFTYNAIQGQLRRYNGEPAKLVGEGEEETALPMSQLAIAAAGAGAATSLVLTPVELIKCRMQVQMIAAEANLLLSAQQAAGAAASTSSTAPGAAAAAAASAKPAPTTTVTVEALNAARRSLPGPLTLLRTTLRQDGLRGLWLGQTGTLLRETGGGVAWFLAFEGACRSFVSRRQQRGEKGVTKSDLSSLELVAAGAAAGVSYNVVLFPADVVKSTMQTEAELAANSSSGTKVKPTGFVGTLQRIWTTRGLRGLYAGCGVTCLRSGPSSAIIFLLYSRLEGMADRRGW